MSARIISISIKPEKVDEFQELYEEYINPEIKTQKSVKFFLRNNN